MIAKISLAVSLILAVLVGYLLVKQRPASPAAPELSGAPVASAFTGETGPKPVVLAYVDGDSLNDQYKFIVEKSGQLESKMKAAEERVKKEYGPRQSEWEELMSYGQNTPDLSEKDAAKLQERMGQLQQEMASIEEREMGVLKKKEADLQQDLQKRVHRYLETYTQSRGIDYVVNHQQAFQLILYGNQAYNITREVIAGLNAEYAAEQEEEKK